MVDAAPAHELSLAPLGAGDLIDRAVRFYRRFFWTFIFMAAPPIVVGTVVFVVWSMLARYLFGSSTSDYAPDTFLYYFFLWMGKGAIWLIESVATLVVMGGASRNFVRHILFGEPISFKETYANAWRRLGGLIVASSSIAIVLGVLGVTIFYLGAKVIALSVLLIYAAIGFLPVVAFLLGLVVGIVEAGLALWLFFLVASRLAYVPQVMLVEGQGVFSAIARSTSLAGGSIRRLAALFTFTTVAAYAALALLYVPLLWYASANGVSLAPFSGDLTPAWYEVASNVVWQISIILMSPVWMVGLCILYVDERVRREGYDIELMAARRLGDIPDVPASYINPLQPALAAHPSPSAQGAASRSNITTLGLE